MASTLNHVALITVKYSIIFGRGEKSNGDGEKLNGDGKKNCICRLENCFELHVLVKIRMRWAGSGFY